MKRYFTRYLLIISTALALAGGLTSCDDGWYPGPPVGWNDTFFDKYLTGSWMLVQANATPVKHDDTNYLEFYGNGRGRYYYYQRGQLYSEGIAYWCKDYFGSNHYEVNIQYQSGQASTMDYWFTNGNSVLWMSWQTPQGTVTYLYDYVNRIP